MGKRQNKNAKTRKRNCDISEDDDKSSYNAKLSKQQDNNIDGLESIEEGVELSEIHLNRLIELAENDNAKGQFELGQYLITFLEKIKEGLRWVFKSAENGCSKAKNFAFTNIQLFYSLVKDQIADDLYLQYSISEFLLMLPVSNAELHIIGKKILSNAAKDGYVKAKLRLLQSENEPRFQRLLSDLESLLLVQASDSVVPKQLCSFQKNIEQENQIKDNLLELANKGIKRAQYMLGVYFITNSESTEFELEKGKDLIQISAKNRHYESQLLLSRFLQDGVLGYQKNMKQAFTFCNEAASHGFAEAEFFLSQYYKGGIGTKKSLKKAFILMKRACDCLWVPAIFQVGLFFKLGIGTEKNDRKAYKYIKKAAKYYDYSDAYYALGTMYIEGQGTIIDEKRGFKSLELASLKGNLPSNYLLGECYSKGVGTDIDHYKAIQFYQKAAKGGHVRGMFKAGLCYLNGKGVPKDIARGLTIIGQSISTECTESDKLYSELKEMLAGDIKSLFQL